MADSFEAMHGLARVAGAQGEAIGALHLLSVATVLREAIGISLSPLEQLAREHTLTTVQEQLDEQAFTLAWAEGRMMLPERVMAAHNALTQLSAIRAAKKSQATRS